MHHSRLRDKARGTLCRAGAFRRKILFLIYAKIYVRVGKKKATMDIYFKTVITGITTRTVVICLILAVMIAVAAYRLCGGCAAALCRLSVSCPFYYHP